MCVAHNVNRSALSSPPFVSSYHSSLHYVLSTKFGRVLIHHYISHCGQPSCVILFVCCPLVAIWLVLWLAGWWALLSVDVSHAKYIHFIGLVFIIHVWMCIVCLVKCRSIVCIILTYLFSSYLSLSPSLSLSHSLCLSLSPSLCLPLSFSLPLCLPLSLNRNA